MRGRTTLAITVGLVLALPAGLAVPAFANAPSASAVDSQAAAAASTAFPAGITRLSGTSRYDTAVAVSQRYVPGVKAAFVATGADFPDALSAAAAAAELGGPLLLTQPNQLPPAVAAELERVQPDVIYVVGGAGVISAGVEKALREISSTERLAGADRYSTADAIIRTVFGSADHAIIATGRDFPDALAATGAAGARHAPMPSLPARSPARSPHPSP